MIAVGARQDTLVDLFERIENFFARLETYIEVPPTTGMTDVIVKIMFEVLSVLAIVTRVIKESRTSEFIPGNGQCSHRGSDTTRR